MGDANHDGASIGKDVVHAVRDGDTGGVQAKVVIVDQARGEVALFGVHADDGESLSLESVSQIAEVEELIVAVGAVAGGEFLVIDSKRITHLMQETGDGVGADDDPEVDQRHGDLRRGPAGPLQTRDRAAGGVIFEQEFDQRNDAGGLFSTG